MCGFFDWLFTGQAVVQTADSERILYLEKKLKEARELLETIVCTQGDDKGVILVDSESPTYYEPAVESMVYEHEYFSLLGGALIELHEKLKD